MLVLMLGVGIYLTVGLKAMPWRKSPRAFRESWIGKRPEGEGKIPGVSTAIVPGGPGAVFWIGMTALVGMATEYGQAVLALRYREVDTLGNHVGGPIDYLRNGMGNRWRWLGWLFADIMNGLMAVPNLVTLAALSPIILRITRKSFGWQSI